MAPTTQKNGRLQAGLETLSMFIARWAGSSWGFACALFVVVVWIGTGPLFHFSDTWQLVINTGTTVVTFLMVFLVQRSQNKDARAIQLKLDELVLAIHAARNKFIDIEELPEKGLDVLQHEFQGVAQGVKAQSEAPASATVTAGARRGRRRPR
jgi:low affinity Fe/Cu permease